MSSRPSRPSSVALPFRPAKLLFALVPCLGAGLDAQTVVLAPSMAQTMDGNSSNLSLLWGSPTAPRAHTQILLDTADLSIASGTLTALAFRPVQSGAAVGVRGTMRIEVSLSGSPHAAAQPDFAANHGVHRVVVFDGPFVIQPTPPGNQTPPAPLSPIQFSTPFAYDGSLGRTLVVDVTTSNLSSSTPYAVGQVGVGAGSMSSIWASGACQNTNGGISGTLGYHGGQPYPGGPFTLGYFGYPTHRASFAASVLLFDFSLTGILGNHALPVPLTDLGLPAAPGCRLAIVPEATAPTAYVPGQNGGSSGHLAFSMQIPALPGLVGARFGTQAISLDHDNRLPGPLLFPSLATRWTIGTGHRPAASMVVRMADTDPASRAGGVQIGQAPVLSLVFQ